MAGYLDQLMGEDAQKGLWWKASHQKPVIKSKNLASTLKKIALNRKFHSRAIKKEATEH